MGERDEHEPIAETFPELIRIQLEELRELARPYLDAIVAELDERPTVTLDGLASVRAAVAVDDEETQVALLAAVIERHLDTGEDMWQRLMSRLYGKVLRRDVAMAEWLNEHAVISRLWEAESERTRERSEVYAEQRAEEQAAKRTRPLPPDLDERLERHRMAAEPWLKRTAAAAHALTDAYTRNREAVSRGEPFDLVQELAKAGIPDHRDIARDIVRVLGEEPRSTQVSVAIAWLYEELNDAKRAYGPGTDLWARLNRRTLPYEAADLELLLDLLAGRQYGFIWAPPVVRAVERHAADGGGIPETWRDSLRTLLADASGARKAEYQKTAVAIRSLLGRGPATRRTLDVSPLDGEDAWSTTARERLAARYGDDGSLNDLVAMLQNSGSAPRPNASWRGRVPAALAASSSSQDALRLLLDTALDVRDELVQRTPDGSWLYSTLGEPAALQIRAAAWAVQLSDAEWAPDLVERVAGDYSGLLFDGQPHSARVANGAVSALALRPGRDAVVRLARLERAMWHGGLRRHLQRELDALAEGAELTRGQLLELSAPDLGLGQDGTRTEPVGAAGALTLSLDERCRLVTRWSVAGSARDATSPSPALRDAEPQRVQELQQVVKQARASLAAERDRVDALFAEQPRWSLSDWCASYVRHPVLRVLGRALVWNVGLGDGARAGLPGDEAGSFVDVEGAAFEASAGSVVALWHPLSAADDDVAAWRSVLFERRVAQPVRQVFRETYRLTVDERRSDHSTRFAGHLLQQRPFRGLLKRRGWTSPALLTWDEGAREVAVAVRAYAGPGVRAELTYAPVWTEEELDWLPAGFQLVGTGRLQFAPAGQKQAEPLALEDVPELVVSEAMRDVDLFVSVCSVALEPAWRDVPDEQLHRQWRELALGELLESARIRRDVLGYVMPELSIADRCTVYERDLVVKGARATYRIHIGSGQVRVDPDGSFLVVPRSRAGAAELARVFLPTDGDDTLAAVLGTAFLLANDDAITDEAFLAQLEAHR